MIGQTISHYKILEKLGEGGMGVVYKAQDTKLDRLVALKFLPSHLSASENDKGRFLREAKAAASLNHPNICTIHGIEESGDELFIVMEFVDGKTLHELKTQAPEIDTVLSWAMQIADALREAHSKGIVHRDIKCENIMVAGDGRIKVMDFGLAKLKDELGLSRTGSTMGTTAYMSPEQHQSFDVDHRTDIWSFGVVLYELLTNRLPFRGEHEAAMMYSITNEEPQPVEKFRPDTPEQLCLVIRKTLEKSPDMRYQSVKDVVADLQQLKHQKVVATAAIKRPETRYAKSGGVNIAYQIVGNGPIDLVYVMGWVSNLDLFWEEPSFARFLNRLSSFSRLILFDKRGTGLSDRVSESELPTLEQRMDDVRAVMDAARSERAVVFGVSEGGPMSALFAATYPERTLGLIMFGSYAKRIWDPEYPWAPTPQERQKFFDAISQGWGGVVDLATLAPSVANDPQFREWWASYLRRSASPGAALALAKMNTQIDIRHVLPAIRVPALIIHRTGDLDIDVGGSRYMAKKIPGAKYVELDGNDHLPWVADQNSVLKEIESFVADIQRPKELDTILCTILVVQSSNEQLLSTQSKSIMTKEIERYRGRVIHSDERKFYASFDGPARAIRSAVAIRNSMLSDGIEIQAGVHTGECEVDGNIFKGLPIQVSEHIMKRALPGEILSSRTVKDLVAGAGIQFKESGILKLEGIESEWQLFSVSIEKEGAKVQTKVQKEKKSIVVLPFENISPDKENEYFGEGLTEEIIANLSKLQMVRVISRITLARYNWTEKTAGQIGADLGVEYLLRGSVRKHGSDLRITTQLIDVHDEAYLWAETYKGTIDDIFDIQETVASKIVGALKVQLTPTEERTLKRRSTQNTEAYQLYLQGRFFWNKRNKEAIQTAIRYFEKAIKEDERYALAWSGVSDAYNLLSEYGGGTRKENYPKAKIAIEKALALDDQLAEARTSLASLMMLDEWDWVNAEKEFKRAIELNPNYATAHHWYAEWLMYMGYVDEAIKEVTIAAELDPLSPAIYKDKGMMFYYARRYDDMFEPARKTLELDPHFSVAHRVLSLAYQEKKMFNEAITENTLWAEMTRNRNEGDVWLAYIKALQGKNKEAVSIIDNLSRAEITSGALFRGIGLTYAALGDNERAFLWLQKAFDMRADALCSLKVDPKADGLRSDKRFTILLRKIGLER